MTVEEAQARAVALARPVGGERVSVRAALGRVLHESVRAPGDVPPHDNSAMDGFAVRAADVSTAPSDLRVVGEVAAGHVFPGELHDGEAIRIMTGAPIPPGADSVVMVEHTEPRGELVRILQPATPGSHVRRRGEDLRAGDEVLAPGTTLGAAELGALATARRAHVQVSRRPLVALLSTGDELRDVDEPLPPGAIPDSNSYTLAALTRQAGAEPRVLPIVRDDPAALRAAIEDARTSADAIVSTGGVSVGEHDHVKSVLADLGATLSLWRVNMKPGKPVALAQLGTTPFFALPGNPVSALVSFLLFVRPALRTMLGCTHPFDLPRLLAFLDGPLKLRGDRRTYLSARAFATDSGELHVRPAARQGSHLLSSLTGTNALIVLDSGPHDLAPNTRVPIHLIAPISVKAEM